MFKKFSFTKRQVTFKLTQNLRNSKNSIEYIPMYIIDKVLKWP